MASLRRLWLSVAFLLLIFLTGTCGYVIIEGWSFGDALYMTVIRDLHIRGKTGTLVIGLHRKGETLQVNPPAETVFQPGDALIVIGNETQVEQLRKMAGHKQNLVVR